MVDESTIHGLSIPRQRMERNPLITPDGYRLLGKIMNHPSAPKWNYEVGDRVIAEDIPLIRDYRKLLFGERPVYLSSPPPVICEWVKKMRAKSKAFRERLPEGMDIARDWASIPPMTREDVALRPQDILPGDADISRLIVYDTSGATGHAMVVPQHPRSMATHLVMMEFVLSRHGVFPRFDAETVACMDIGARVKTVVFANVFSVWNQGGFAKINLSIREWASAGSAREFISGMAPAFFTGDPVGYTQMIKWGVEAAPLAMVSCAMKLSAALKDELEKRYRCPVIDTYSTTETGPVGYSAPDGLGMSVLPHDVYVEAVDASGFPVAPGEMGELTITGGRNPYLPLLRYRTGDYGRIISPPPNSADTAPRIVDFEGRRIVSFRAMDGTIVSQADVGLALRKFVFAQSQFVQLADGALEIAIRPIPGVPSDTDGIEGSVRSLFGDGQKITVVEDDSLEGKKIVPFRCELDETRSP